MFIRILNVKSIFFHIHIFTNKARQYRGAFVDQLIDISSGHDLTFMGLSPALCSVPSMMPTWDYLSPSLSLLPTCIKINK